ncbi:hypothetical protein A2773_06565 [Candidatus Gottesmanbacteria bacterium RIFCSPHIGHO2_01_FULL_39_10]|uniref:Uncharacterized protein n=1 Tax=Candidatus Gottesmanbacteria bacterium RIFCSPHIGHO2_01_FULL_39_10 TaxID=1798375 RepID=A0A1F5ZQ62_9BACT|nr:MAG: hypothetical protein A2773_06565 [Candidatus Gottesmanbacteria bacterium RIFCSPHIGHO2_01_FULL_39_10]
MPGFGSEGKDLGNLLDVANVIKRGKDPTKLSPSKEVRVEESIPGPFVVEGDGTTGKGKYHETTPLREEHTKG